jgi:hypothetical protein
VCSRRDLCQRNVPAARKARARRQARRGRIDGIRTRRRETYHRDSRGGERRIARDCAVVATPNAHTEGERTPRAAAGPPLAHGRPWVEPSCSP